MRLGAAIVIAAGALLVGGCSCGDEPLVVVIQVQPEVAATCLRLSVTEPSLPGTQGVLRGTRDVPRVADAEYRVAVFRGTFQREMDFSVMALTGANGCNQPLTQVSASPLVRGDFETTGTRVVTVVVGPSAEALAIVPPQNGQLVLNVCTPATIEGRFDGGLASVFRDTPVSFSLVPDAGLSVYADTACQVEANGAAIPKGETSLNVRLRASDAGTYALTASAAGLLPDQALLSAVASASTSVSIANLAAMALRGSCVGPVSVQIVDSGGIPTSVPAPTTVSLSASTSAGFFSDAACTVPITSVVVPAGASAAAVYVRPNAAGALAIGASAPGFASDVESLQVVPNVRRGTCQLTAGTDTVACAINPPVFDLSRAFAMVQAIPSGPGADEAEIRCTLTSPNEVSCFREGTTGRAQITWQVAELASGIHVQRAVTPCAATTTVTFPQAFTPSQSFVLHTAQHGGALSDDDYKTARILNSTQVELFADNNCGATGTNDVQVVDLTGASVSRGQTGVMAAATMAVGPVSIVDLARTFLLNSSRFTSDTGGVLCAFHVRGELDSPTSLAFSRGDSSSGCDTPDVADVAWERVQLPVGYAVQQVVMAMTDGGSFASQAIAAVDPTRTLVFASGQFNSGQGFGETAYDGDERPGAVGAQFALGAADRLDLTRMVDAGTARWTGYVVQLP